MPPITLLSDELALLEQLHRSSELFSHSDCRRHWPALAYICSRGLVEVVDGTFRLTPCGRRAVELARLSGSTCGLTISEVELDRPRRFREAANPEPQSRSI